VDAARVALLRELLAPTGWVDRTRAFSRAMRQATRLPRGLLLVGTPEEEPWHLAAHLDDEARLGGVPQLAPTLVRWRPPPGAPAHLGIGLDRLTIAGRGESLLVVAPQVAPAQLLERVSDARRGGATVFAVDGGDPDLEDLAHDALVVPTSGLLPGGATGDPMVIPDLSLPTVSFDAVQHLLSAATTDTTPLASARQRGLRRQLARLLDTLSGPPPEPRR